MQEGNAIKFFLRKTGVTQRQLAEFMGISYQYLNQMLKGERKISKKRMQQVCEALEVEQSDIERIKEVMELV